MANKTLFNTSRGLNDTDVHGEDLIDAASQVLVIGACLCEFGGGADAITVLDLLAYLDLWLEQDSFADLDGGGVDISDLLRFLECWFEAGRSTCT